MDWHIWFVLRSRDFSSLALCLTVRVFGSLLLPYSGIFQISPLGHIVFPPGIALAFHYRNGGLETPV